MPFFFFFLIIIIEKYLSNPFSYRTTIINECNFLYIYIYMESKHVGKSLVSPDELVWNSLGFPKRWNIPYKQNRLKSSISFID